MTMCPPSIIGGLEVTTMIRLMARPRGRPGADWGPRRDTSFDQRGFYMDAQKPSVFRVAVENRHEPGIRRDRGRPHRPGALVREPLAHDECNLLRLSGLQGDSLRSTVQSRENLDGLGPRGQRQ